MSLLSNPMMELGATGDVGRRLGMFMSIFSLGALSGPPISGAINAASGGFEAVGYYAGGRSSNNHLIFTELITYTCYRLYGAFGRSFDVLSAPSSTASYRRQILTA